MELKLYQLTVIFVLISLCLDGVLLYILSENIKESQSFDLNIVSVECNVSFIDVCNSYYDINITYMNYTKHFEIPLIARPHFNFTTGNLIGCYYVKDDLNTLSLFKQQYNQDTLVTLWFLIVISFTLTLALTFYSYKSYKQDQNDSISLFEYDEL